MESYRLRMDLQFFSQEKTEKATPKKRQESREKGQVAKSMELPGAFILLFSFLAFLLMGGFIKTRFYDLFTVAMHDYLTWELTMSNVTIIYSQLLFHGLIILAPFFIIAVVIALLGNYVQIGVLFTGHPLIPKFSKLNPIQGFKNIFSMRALVEFSKSILKVLIIGTLVYTTLWSERERIVGLSKVSLENIFEYTAQLTIMLGIKVGVGLVILAVFDYLYQRYDYEKKLRMSKQDIKDEFKKSEGDPLIKSKIRERQRRMALQRMMQEVPKADVVITNPTHYAVALQYDQEQMDAPLVIAKGQDYVALKIREVAEEHGIVTMENKPLARALYDQVEIGESVPPELFQAVAEVLAYVYRLKRRV